MAVIDAGLGWSADERYLVYDAGTDLGTSNDRHFYKSGNGYAVAVYSVGAYGRNWYGPVLISTVPENVSNTQEASYGTVIEYLGLTWYVNHGYHYINASYETPLIEWTDYYSTGAELALHVLEAAGVTVPEFTITYDTAGGSAIEPFTAPEGTPVPRPYNPTRAGYRFVGWRPSVPLYMPANDLTITAVWERDVYTIAFNTGGGSYVPNITAPPGTAITPPPDPTKAGCRFIGWSPAIPSVMPSHNLTVTAQWSDVRLSFLIGFLTGRRLRQEADR